MASYYGQMPPGFEQAWNPLGPPPVFHEPPMDPALMAQQAAAQEAAGAFINPDAESPFGHFALNDPNATLGGQGRNTDIPPGPLALPAHGEPEIPVAAQPQAPPQRAVAHAGRRPGGIGGGEPAGPLQQPGRNPDDVKAMRMENARRQYEQRFGQSPMGPGGQRQQSMAASGQQGELDALIARLSQARMSQMADRRTARRG
jgi:hypothetical protein